MLSPQIPVEVLVSCLIDLERHLNISAPVHFLTVHLCKCIFHALFVCILPKKKKKSSGGKSIQIMYFNEIPAFKMLFKEKMLSVKCA